MNTPSELREPVNLAIGETNHRWLERFKEEHVFSEMRDAYRFAFSYAIAKELHPSEIVEKKETVFSLATIDPDRDLFNFIAEFYSDIDIPRYHILERLADAGMTELVKLYKQGLLDLMRIVEDIGGQ